MAADLGEKETSEDTTEGEEKIREDENGDDLSTGKRAKHSKKHKHKHSKKHKHKHKKRKHKRISLSRSRSKSSSRSRSRSPDSNADECDEPLTKSEPDTKVDVINDENAAVKPESDNKTNGKGVERDESPFEDIALAECDSSFSFKLTKSPSGSVSPQEPELKESIAKDPDIPKVENRINLGFPLKIASFLESISKSPEVADQKIDERSGSGSPIDPMIKVSSRSPRSGSASQTKKRSQSPSDSKIRKRSRSRSRSRTRTQSRKSRSKSPKKNDSKKKSKSSMSPRSKSRSKSHSRSRSKSHNKHSQSKSRSRSPHKHKHKGRSRSRSSSYSRKKSKKKEKKSHSRSPRRKAKNYNNRGRSRSLTYRDRRSRHDASPQRSKRESSNDRKRHFDKRSWRTRSRSPRRRRSKSVSPQRRRHKSRSRSPRRARSKTPRSDRFRYRSRSRAGRSKRRSRSRSSRRRSSSRRRRSRSHSRSRSRDRRHNRSKSKEKNDSEGNKSTRDEKGATTAVNPTMNASKPSVQDLVGKAPEVSGPVNKRSLAQLTEFCKKLTEARGIETPGNETESIQEEEEDVSVEISHPFLVAPKRDITIPQVIFPVKLLLPTSLLSSDKPLTEQFPVSCGTKHHEKEEEAAGVYQIIPDVNGSAMQAQQVFQPPQQMQQKLDISSLVVKRMDAQRKLHADPNDLDAMLSLQEVEMKLNSWCQSNVKPGQYTGQLAKTMMPKEKFNSGYQAWAKKDMFHNLNPVCGGVGMKLLQKMGWEPGQVLGKRGEGMAEPIALTVKVDRRGLSSISEKPAGKKSSNKSAIDLQGKHPISSLQEYCARRKWQVPDFTLIFDEGPPHSKQFLFKVAVNGYEYQYPVVSGNKKHAKAQAAVAALKGLGLVPEDADY